MAQALKKHSDEDLDDDIEDELTFEEQADLDATLAASEAEFARGEGIPAEDVLREVRQLTDAWVAKRR